MKNAFYELKSGKALAADLLCKEYFLHMHDDTIKWVAQCFKHRCVAESSHDYKQASSSRKRIEARELAKPGRMDIRNNRIIARYEFCEK